MKIAVSAAGQTAFSLVDPRFGRCPYFLMMETDSMSTTVCSNESAGLQGGAGIQAAAFLADKGVKVVLTGRCGPNALLALAAAGIELYEALGGIPVQEAVDKFLAGKLTPSGEKASAAFPEVKTAAFGMGPGCGRGAGRRRGNMGPGRGGQGRRFGGFGPMAS